MPFDKPIKVPREKRRMRRGEPINGIGPVGRARLELNLELREQALKEDWLFTCELKVILIERGLAGVLCGGPLEFCHSMKHRGDSYELAREVARGCQFHHYPMDELAPRLVTKIVREAIARRYMEPDSQLSLSLLELGSCYTCLSVLTKTPSHDSRFERHLKHATLADLNMALNRTIEMKTSRRLIMGRIRQLERQATRRSER